MIRNSEGFFNALEYSSDRIIIQKAKIFHNKEGLKDQCAWLYRNMASFLNNDVQTHQKNSYKI